MFCTECGETVQLGSKFCGSCGNEIRTTASMPAPESDDNPTWVRVLFVLWSFAYASVGAGVLLFLVNVFGWLGAETSLWLTDNLLIISAIVGLANALTRGVASARRM